jgi:hypothetical protein
MCRSLPGKAPRLRAQARIARAKDRLKPTETEPIVADDLLTDDELTALLDDDGASDYDLDADDLLPLDALDDAKLSDVWNQIRNSQRLVTRRRSLDASWLRPRGVLLFPDCARPALVAARGVGAPGATSRPSQAANYRRMAERNSSAHGVLSKRPDWGKVRPGRTAGRLLACGRSERNAPARATQPLGRGSQPGEESSMASTANRTVAFDRSVFRALYGTFGASVAELAEQVEASVDRTRAALKRLEAKGLAASQDVNDAAQGDRRSGSFKSLAWTSEPNHDSATAEEADEAFNVAYDAPTLADDEVTDKPNHRTDEPEPDTVTLPETPEAYGDDRAAFLRDHLKNLGRSKADKAQKAAARAELATLGGSASKPSANGDGASRSQARKCHCDKCGSIIRMSPGAEKAAGGLPTCACGGTFVRSNVAE